MFFFVFCFCGVCFLLSVGSSGRSDVGLACAVAGDDRDRGAVLRLQVRLPRYIVYLCGA